MRAESLSAVRLPGACGGRLWLLGAVAAALLCLATPSARGVTPTISTYVGGSGDWIIDLDDIDDWVHLPPPIPGFDFFLFPDNTTSRLFSVWTGTGSGNYLRLREPLIPVGVTVNDLHVSESDTFEIDAATLQIAFPGFVENDGTIVVKDGQLVTSLFAPGLLNIHGSGTIQMQGSSTLGSWLGAVAVDGQHITGEGTITGTVLSLDSLIDANLPGETLNVTFTISGSGDEEMFASDGGKLEIKSAIGTTADFRSERTITARRGGVVELRDMDFENNSIVRAEEGGVVQLKNTRVDNLGHVFEVSHGVMNLRGDASIAGGVITAGPQGQVVVLEGQNDFVGPMTLSGLFRVQGGMLDFEPGPLGEYHAESATFDILTQLNVHNVTVFGGTFTGAGRAYVRASSTLKNTTVDGGHILVPGNHQLALIETLTLDDGGLITIEDLTLGLGTSDAELLANGPVTIEGTGGVIRFAQISHDYHLNALRAVNGGSFAIGPHIRIEAPKSAGRGYIQAPLVNAGVVDANGGSIYVQTPGITNTGAIGATLGGTLHFETGIVIQNTGGRLFAGEGSTIRYSNATVVGGTLDGSGTHRNTGYNLLDGSSDSVVIDSANVFIPGNTRLTLLGTITNNGTIYMSDQHLGFPAINAELVAQGSVVIGGSGRIVFDGTNHSNNNNEIRANPGSSYTFGKDLTLTTDPGKNGVGIFYAPFTNEGVIQSHGGYVTIFSETLRNAGEIRAVSGGQIHLGRYNGSTVLDNIGGTLFADPGSVFTSSGFTGGAFGVTTIRGGTFAGGGEFRMGPYMIIDGTTEPFTIMDSTVSMMANSAFGAFAYIYGNVHLDNGTFAIRDTSTHNRLYLASAGSGFTGSGTIRFENTSFVADNILQADHGLNLGSEMTLTTSANGDGTVVGNIVSAGGIDASAASLRLHSASITNGGILGASAGGSLFVGTPGGPTVTILNAGGEIRAGAGSTIHLGQTSGPSVSSAVVHGGSITGHGSIQVARWALFVSTPDNPMSITDATIIGRGSTDTYFQGTFALDDATFMVADNAAGFGTWEPAFRASGQTQVNGEGKIQFGQNGFNLVNRLVADAGSSWTLAHGITITAPTGSTGRLEGTVNTHGSLHTDANIDIASGVTTIFHDGTLTGSGSINVWNGAAFVNHGTTSPGNSPGTLTVHGTYTLGDTARLLIELAGAAPGEYDRLQVNGLLKLDGQLDIALLNGFTPSPEDTFVFLTATGGIVGAFDNVLTPDNRLRTADGWYTMSRVGNSFAIGGFEYDPVPEPGTAWGLATLLCVLRAQRHRRV